MNKHTNCTSCSSSDTDLTEIIGLDGFDQYTYEYLCNNCYQERLYHEQEQQYAYNQ